MPVRRRHARERAGCRGPWNGRSGLPRGGRPAPRAGAGPGLTFDPQILGLGQPGRGDSRRISAVKEQAISEPGESLHQGVQTRPAPAGAQRELGPRPYGGAYDEITPHLTIGDHGPVDQMRAAEDVVAPFLPIHARAAELALFQGGPAGWAEVPRFLFR